jgi:hypothetical protein
VNAPGIVGQSPLPKTDAFATLRVAMWARPNRAWGGNGVRLFRYLARSRLNTAPVFYRHESDAHSRQLARDKGKNPQNRQGEAILSKNCQGRNQKPNYSEGKDLLLGFIAASLVLPLDRLRPELVLGLLIALVLPESHGVTIPHRPDVNLRR